MAGIGINNGVVNYGGVPSAGAGLLANRPVFGVTGRLYIGTDTNALYRDTGSAWVTISAGISGTAATGQATFWSSATTISGDNAFFWDNTNKRLGLGTATPGVRLDVHGAGVIQQLNGTTTNSAYLDFQNAGTTAWRIGNNYNGGSPLFQLIYQPSSTNVININSNSHLLLFSTTDYYNYDFQVKGTIYSYSNVQDKGIVIFNSGTVPTITGVIPSSGSSNNFTMQSTGGFIRIGDTSNPAVMLSVSGSVYQGSNTANSNFQLLCSANFYTGGFSPNFFTYTAGPVTIPLTNTGLVFKTAATITATLPLASGINNQYYIVVLAGTVVTLNRSGSDNIINTVGATVTSLTLTGYTKTLLYSDGGTTWYQLF